MTRPKGVVFSAIAVFTCFSALVAAQPKPKTIAETTAGARKIEGFIDFYWDEKSGKMWLETNRIGQEFLYVVSLPAGVGSNDIGLDRGQLGRTRVVRFDRVGPKLLLVQPNYEYRALSNNEDERKAVRDSFAESVLWGFDIAAEDGGRVLVDATQLLLRDAHGIGQALQRTRQGQYRVDASRSAIYLPMTKGFPRNSEVETTLTLTGDPQGRFIADVTPTPDAVTVRQRHSFVQLPETASFVPRPFDPRAGYFGFDYADFATPVGEPLSKKFTPRHRLAPGGTITYYVDRGAPEPIRTALVEGARWWSQAFEAAGFPNGFRVEVLPEGADPMDIGYNVINWVHRATRGWSYGSTVTDPRTGEILKGHVTLGSLRVRQDYLIAEGVIAPYEQGRPVPEAMMKMGLARLRQLSAHEVGHTLGLAHAYAGSAQDRSSVMDYPHPWIALKGDNAQPDLSEAYAAGIGEWDKVSIAYGYRAFPSGTDERRELNRLLMEAAKRGLVFLTDQDARPDGSLHPAAHLWDGGKDASTELERLIGVRAKALARFDERVIREGAPMSTLENALVPVYLLHRYQVLAASKVLGGSAYTFALRGDGQVPIRTVNGADQRRALTALLRTLQPEFLAVPKKVLSLIPPPATGYARTRENFSGRMGLAFDPLSTAEASADLTVSQILNSERAARLVLYGAQDSANPGWNEVVQTLLDATWAAAPQTGVEGELQNVVKSVVVYRLMSLAANDGALAQVRAVARQHLRRIAAEGEKSGSPAMHAYLAERIRRFEANPKEVTIPKPAEAPPGQPIGCEEN